MLIIAKLDDGVNLYSLTVPPCAAIRAYDALVCSAAPCSALGSYSAPLLDPLAGPLTNAACLNAPHESGGSSGTHMAATQNLDTDRSRLP